MFAAVGVEEQVSLLVQGHVLLVLRPDFPHRAWVVLEVVPETTRSQLHLVITIEVLLNAGGVQPHNHQEYLLQDIGHSFCPVRGIAQIENDSERADEGL